MKKSLLTFTLILLLVTTAVLSAFAQAVSCEDSS